MLPVQEPHFENRCLNETETWQPDLQLTPWKCITKADVKRDVWLLNEKLQFYIRKLAGQNCNHQEALQGGSSPLILT